MLERYSVNHFKVLTENLYSKGFSFEGYMRYFSKMHICLKISINGHEVFLNCSLDEKLVFAAMKALCPKY